MYRLPAAIARQILSTITKNLNSKENFVNLRILAIHDHKISKKIGVFWGIDINVFKNTHLALQKCIICQVATIGSILKFESK